ncbi:MAG TPA: hypothetical protein VFS76_04695 [Pyrinomonadaceae bacterium]|nr:hypothetical protein [Pyrinomonadaceae bacterium]
MDDVFNYPHLISLSLVVAISTFLANWHSERRRGQEEGGLGDAIAGSFLTLVFTLFYCSVAFLLPAIVVAVVLDAVFSLPEATPDVVLAENAARIATLFAAGANFADVSSTYGRTTFLRHLRQYLLLVPVVYYATMALAWLGAQILAGIFTYLPANTARAWRLFAVPSLSTHIGLNIIVFVTLYVVMGVVSFFLRRRGEERGLVESSEEAHHRDEAAERNFIAIHELARESRKQHALASDAEAFVYLFLQKVLLLKEDAIRDALTHGPDDGGIDAIHVDHKGAQVVGCDYQGAHIVVCDYADSLRETKRPINRARLERLVKTWIAISSSNDEQLKLNPALRRRIEALHRYWDSIKSVHVPHDIYIVTNRQRSGIDRAALKSKMDYYQSEFYHFYEQDDLIACLANGHGP